MLLGERREIGREMEGEGRRHEMICDIMWVKGGGEGRM
jgi:hypothetical protein